LLQQNIAVASFQAAIKRWKAYTTGHATQVVGCLPCLLSLHSVAIQGSRI